VVTCPNCKGKGEVFAFIDGETFRECTRVECHSCEGNKEVTPEHYEAMLKGKVMREDRLKRYMTLRAEAERLGITALELSKMERGEK